MVALTTRDGNYTVPEETGLRVGSNVWVDRHGNMHVPIDWLNGGTVQREIAVPFDVFDGGMPYEPIPMELLRMKA